MKKILVSLVLLCTAVFGSYAQKDIPAGSSMEIASAGSDDDEITLYKVKDKEGNPCFYLAVRHTTAKVEMELFGGESVFSAAEGSLVNFGTTLEEATENLDALLGLFIEPEGAQMEFTCKDGSKILFTLQKGFFGKYLTAGPSTLRKSDLKSLKTGIKISKALHPGL